MKGIERLKVDAKEIEDEFEQLSWAKGVPAPKDADGVQVPLDTKKLYTISGSIIRVVYICLVEGLWRVQSMDRECLLLLHELYYNEQGKESIAPTLGKRLCVNGAGIEQLKDNVSYLTYSGKEKLTVEIEEKLNWAAGVPTPTDADGNVVPLTTEVLYNGAGRKLKVRDIQFTREGAYQWTAYCIPQGRSVADLFIINCTYLHCPESWEQLEKDAKLAPRAYLEERGLDPEKNDRVAFMATDLVRRAKAIAKRDKEDK